MLMNYSKKLKAFKKKIAELSFLFGMVEEKRQRNRFISIGILMIIGAALTGLAPLALKYIVNNIAYYLGNRDYFWPELIIFSYVLALVVARITTEISALIFAKFEQRVHLCIKDIAVGHLLRMPLMEHAKQSPGRLTQSINNATRGSSRLLQSVLAGLGPIAFQIATVLLVLSISSNMVILSAFIIAGTAYAIVFSMGSRTLSHPQELAARSLSDFNSMLTDVLMHPETVKLTSSESYWQQRLKMLLLTSEAKWVYYYSKRFGNSIQVVVVFCFAITSVSLVALWQIIAGIINIGDFVLIIVYLNQVIRPLEVIGHAYRDAHQGLSLMDELIMLLKIPTELPRIAAMPEPMKHQKSYIVHFDNVRFAYTTDEMSLSDISFSVKPGDKIAFVGSSGSGKSTIIRLLTRLYNPASGRIEVAGNDLREWDIQDLRKFVCVVPQDTSLFDGTIEENIILGGTGGEGPVLALDRAIELSGVCDFVAHLPNGIKTLVGPGGLKLSGGQRQRIGIARAVFRNPQLLVFDEATSSLDPVNELKIMTKIEAEFKITTQLVFTHRLYTIVNSACIFVLDHGRIIEQGRHDDLLARDDLYAKLWQSQSHNKHQTTN